MATPELNQAFFQRNSGKIGTRHFDRIIEKARDIEDKVKEVPALHRFWKDVLLCLELIRDYRLGLYRNTPTWVIAAVAFGLLYLIDPLELIPDLIPVVGYLDEVTTIALILKLVKTELTQYAAWRQAKAQDIASLARDGGRWPFLAGVAILQAFLPRSLSAGCLAFLWCLFANAPTKNCWMPPWYFLPASCWLPAISLCLP